jgi:hypothetical protein
MTNDFDKINGDSEFRNEMTVASNEPAPDSHLEADYEDRNGCGADLDAYVGWPGDGSGEDDFQDFNQNESLDYSDE